MREEGEGDGEGTRQKILESRKEKSKKQTDCVQGIFCLTSLVPYIHQSVKKEKKVEMEKADMGMKGMIGEKGKRGKRYE